jgi:NAD(P)-dependent dehydrogenase (short-subunit alcohol dehydrogenase family)
MGIAAFTIIAARELSRYGITVHAIAPVADLVSRACRNAGINGQDLD